MQKLTLRDFATRGFRATLERLGINPIELIETAISQRESITNVAQPDPSTHTIHELIETAVTMSGDQELAFRIGHGLDMTEYGACLLYTSPSPRDRTRSRMPSSA